jgi:hypothetical protein
MACECQNSQTNPYMFHLVQKPTTTATATATTTEMDFLEPGWNKPATAALNYTQSFATQNNQAGRCFPAGVNPGGFNSQNVLLTESLPPFAAPNHTPEPIVYVAVYDAIGAWVYRIPAAEVEARESREKKNRVYTNKQYRMFLNHDSIFFRHVHT